MDAKKEMRDVSINKEVSTKIGMEGSLLKEKVYSLTQLGFFRFIIGKSIEELEQLRNLIDKFIQEEKDK